MSVLLDIINPHKTEYVDRKFPGPRNAYFEALAKSTTLYVGNLSFYTSEEQIHELFSRAGDVKRVIMGLDAMKKTPCGFCFVIYYTRRDAQDAVTYLNGTLLDERNIRVDFDWGFREGRQFGRGKSGGQVRDEYRQDYDEGRGGYGARMQAAIDRTKQQVSMLTGLDLSQPGSDAVYFEPGQQPPHRARHGSDEGRRRREDSPGGGGVRRAEDRSAPQRDDDAGAASGDEAEQPAGEGSQGGSQEPPNKRRRVANEDGEQAGAGDEGDADMQQLGDDAEVSM